MIIDHIGYYFYPDELWFRAVGRICVPIWLFLIGYARTRRIDVFLLGGAALLIAADAALMRSPLPLNILVTILLVRVSLNPLMRWIDNSDTKLLIATMVLCVLFPVTSVLIEYGTLALVFGISGYVVRNGFGKMTAVPLLYAAFTVATFTVTQHHLFDFSMAQNMLIFAGSSAAMVALVRYLPQHPSITIQVSTPVQKTLRFLGTRTLEIYVVHLILFKIAVALLCGCLRCSCHPHFNPLSLVS